MNCEGFRNRLLDFVEKEIPESEYAAYASHLNDCSTCSKLLSEIQGIMQEIDEEKKVELNPYLIRRIEERLALAPSHRVSYFSLPTNSFAPILAGFAGIIVGLYLSWMVGLMDTESETDEFVNTTDQIEDQQETSAETNVLTLNE